MKINATGKIRADECEEIFFDSQPRTSTPQLTLSLSRQRAKEAKKNEFQFSLLYNVYTNILNNVT